MRLGNTEGMCASNIARCQVYVAKYKYGKCCFPVVGCLGSVCAPKVFFSFKELHQGTVKLTVHRLLLVRMSVHKNKLHLAAEQGNLSLVRKLVESKAIDITSTTELGSTAIHFAAFCAHHHILDYLLQLGVDVNTKNVNAATPLYYACTAGNSETMAYLIMHGAFVSSTTLLGACTAGNEKIVRTLFNLVPTLDANCTCKGFFPLYAAAIRGSPEITKFLIEKGADLQKKAHGYTGFHAAISRGHIHIAKILIDYGYNVREEREEVMGSLSKDLETVNFLKSLKHCHVQLFLNQMRDSQGDCLLQCNLTVYSLDSLYFQLRQHLKRQTQINHSVITILHADPWRVIFECKLNDSRWVLVDNISQLTPQMQLRYILLPTRRLWHNSKRIAFSDVYLECQK